MWFSVALPYRHHSQGAKNYLGAETMQPSQVRDHVIMRVPSPKSPLARCLKHREELDLRVDGRISRSRRPSGGKGRERPGEEKTKPWHGIECCARKHTSRFGLQRSIRAASASRRTRFEGQSLEDNLQDSDNTEASGYPRPLASPTYTTPHTGGFRPRKAHLPVLRGLRRRPLPEMPGRYVSARRRPARTCIYGLIWMPMGCLSTAEDVCLWAVPHQRCVSVAGTEGGREGGWGWGG